MPRRKESMDVQVVAYFAECPANEMEIVFHFVETCVKSRREIGGGESASLPILKEIYQITSRLIKAQEKTQETEKPRKTRRPRKPAPAPEAAPPAVTNGKAVPPSTPVHPPAA